MEDTRYHRREVRLQGGGMLFLYTDGIVDAVASTGMVLYGKERLKAFLDANARLPLRELLSGIGGDIAAFSSGAEQADDITMLALRLPQNPENYSRCSSITLNACFAEFPALANFIAAELDKASCPAKARGQIELAVEEIFVNIVNYAYHDQPETGEKEMEIGELQSVGEVTVECVTGAESNRTTMTLSFTDSGCPFNPVEYAAPDTGMPLEERQPGKLGILIVRKTMDTIFYSREKGVNCLRISKSWQAP
jgi:sigma-B regulation protein RsbU (phosphoserine phosphatase)